MEEIVSIGDYASLFTAKLRSLRHLERCIFSAWCAEYLFVSHASLIEQSLPEADLKTLQDVLNRLWDALLTGSIPDKGLLNELDDELVTIGPDDPVAELEVHPAVSSVRRAVGICVLCCRRNEVRLAQMAGQMVVEVLSYEVAERESGHGKNSFEDMFRHSEVKVELESQVAMIRYLRGKYALDASLRSAFRR